LIPRLFDEGIDPSVGYVDDAYDNFLAESQIGLCKSDLIHHGGLYRDVEQVEVATAGWSSGSTPSAPKASIHDLTPLELEQLDYALTEPLEAL